MWNYMQLTVQIPEKIPEADYFLKSIDNPFFMNLFRCLLAGGAVIMLLAIHFFQKREDQKKEDEKAINEEG